MIELMNMRIGIVACPRLTYGDAHFFVTWSLAKIRKSGAYAISNMSLWNEMSIGDWVGGSLNHLVDPARTKATRFQSGLFPAG